MLLGLIVNSIGFLHLLTQTFYQLHKEKVKNSALINETLLLRWIILILVVMVDNICIGVAEVIPFGVYVYNYYKLMVFLSNSDFHVKMLQKFIVKADPDVLGEFVQGLVARVMIRVMHRACMLLKKLSLPVSQADFNLSQEIMTFLEEYHPRIIKTSTNINNISILDTSVLEPSEEDIAMMRRREALRRVREEEKEKKRKQLEEELKQQEELLRVQQEQLEKRRQAQLEALNKDFDDSFSGHDEDFLDQSGQDFLSLLDTKNNTSQKQGELKPVPQVFTTETAGSTATTPSEAIHQYSHQYMGTKNIRYEVPQTDSQRVKAISELENSIPTTQNASRTKEDGALSSEKKLKTATTAISAARSFDGTIKKQPTTIPIKSTLPVDTAVAASRLRAAQSYTSSSQYASTTNPRSSTEKPSFSYLDSTETKSTSAAVKVQLNDAKYKYEQYKLKYSSALPTKSNNDSIHASKDFDGAITEVSKQ